MESINGKVVVLPYFPAQSSTDIKNNIIEKEIRSKIK